jgi:flagellar hook-basal body complex protein FliE
MMDVRPLFVPPTSVESGAGAKPVATLEGASGPSFMETMETAVASVDGAQKEAAQKAGEMAAGVTSIDEAMIAIEKADTGFRLMTQVRNKVVDAYREMMRLNF